MGSTLDHHQHPRAFHNAGTGNIAVKEIKRVGDEIMQVFSAT